MSRNPRAAKAIEDLELPDESQLEALYSPEYLVECADGEARQERLAEIKRRIERDAYDVDADRIADGLLSKGDLD